MAGLLLPVLACWAAFAPVPGRGQDYTFATFAGIAGKTGTTDGTVGGSGLPLFNNPIGLVVGASGNIYITDAGNGVIRVVTPAGVVTTFVGTAGISGAIDGTGPAASFNSPLGPAMDIAGNLYLADLNNNTVRKIDKDGKVTTLAGLAGTAGTTDGTGTAARFNRPSSVAVDSSGNLYVADTGSHTIRKIVIATGVVTTFAGKAGIPGSADPATGITALFHSPRGVAADAAGNVYVADTGNNTIRKITPAGVVSTLAGLAGTYGSADGLTTNARFNFPDGLTVDGAGNVYVADELNNAIRKVTAAGAVTIFAGLAGAPAGAVDGTGTAARFNRPSGVAFDAAGNLFVADYNNQLIRKVTPAGAVTTVAGASGIRGSQDGSGANLTTVLYALFTGPSSTATDGAGNVYVADTGNNVIRMITPGGVVSTLAGNPKASGQADGAGSSASFNSPGGIALDLSNNVYVADTNNHVIRMITPLGQVTTIAGTAGTPGSADGAALSASFNYPSSVAVDAAGNIYVSDYNNHTVRKIAAGLVSTLAGTAGIAGHLDAPGIAASFNHPRNLAVDGAGNVYLADTGNNTIRKITAGGAVSTLAGAAGAAGHSNGTGGAATFNGPAGIAVDGAGDLFVSDTNNNTIRRVTAAGVVTTLGGVAGTAGTADGVGAAAYFNHPTGMALDAAGNIYFADNRNHTIRVGTPPGGTPPPAVTPPGGSPPGGSTPSVGDPNSGTPSGTVATGNLLRPSGVCMDAAGAVYLADTANNVIKKLTGQFEYTVLAGKVGQAGSADGTGTAALFSGPTAIVADASGNIYVCDTGNSTIRKISPAGEVKTLAGSAGKGGTTDGTGSAALFSAPSGIVLDGAGNLFVSDSTNCTIRMITPSGVVTTLAGTAKSIGDKDGVGSAALFNNPTGLAIDGAANVYVADTYNNTIRKVTTSAVAVTATAVGTITTAGAASVVLTDAGLTGSPLTVSVDVLLDDSPTAWAARVVTKLQATAAVTARYAVASSGPSIYVTTLSSVAIGATLNVALADGTCKGVVAAPTSVAVVAGTVTTLAGSPGISGAYDGSGGYALFNLPMGLSVDSSYVVYVADTGNNCIRAITPNGAVFTIAGIAGISGNRNGTITTALFNQPRALYYASPIFVADTGNSLLRTVNGFATVTTPVMKEPAATTTTTPSTGSSGGGGLESWFAAALLVLGGLACVTRRK